VAGKCPTPSASGLCAHLPALACGFPRAGAMLRLGRREASGSAAGAGAAVTLGSEPGKPSLDQDDKPQHRLAIHTPVGIGPPPVPR